MAYNLTIDQGNSSTKLALWDESDNIVSTETLLHFSARDVASYASGHEIDTAIFCSVSRRPPVIIKALERRARRAIDFGINTPSPLTVDYGTPATLGLDRLAAAIGAYYVQDCKNHELLVVDIGTAITYDRVSADAHYMGGNIAPGIYMRLKALNHYTARLPLVDPRLHNRRPPKWGHDTESALLAGAVNGVVAELEYYYSQFSTQPKVIMTGGDAMRVAPLLSFDTIVEPNLVSLGLLKVIEFNKSCQ